MLGTRVALAAAGVRAFKLLVEALAAAPTLACRTIRIGRVIAIVVVVGIAAMITIGLAVAVTMRITDALFLVMRAVGPATMPSPLAFLFLLQLEVRWGGFLDGFGFVCYGGRRCWLRA